MFREIVRSKQAIPYEECVDILKREKRGVLAVPGDEDYPYAVPLNHYYCPEDGKIYFHSGRKGHKVDAILRDNRASFCVYDGGFRKEGEWSLNIRSVIIFGRIEIVEDQEEINRISRLLSYRFTDDEGYIEKEIKQYGAATMVFALVPEQITGKIINEG